MDSALLVNPPKAPFTSENIWGAIKESSLPIGLVQLAAFIRASGFSVRIIDLCVEEYTEMAFRERLRELNPTYVGFTSTTIQINNGLRLAKLVKEELPRARIVFGGVHPTVLPEEVVCDEAVDYVVRGEGEESTVKLLSGEDASKIDGLSYKEGGRILHNGRGEFIQNLDILPYPAYDLLRLGDYTPTLGNFKKLPSISMITSRGCPGTCTFCYSGTMGARIRFMSAPRILGEIQMLRESYGIRDICFYDDTFTANKKNVIELCDLMIESDMDITWSCMSRLDAVSSDVLEKMGEAGCHQIGYGIESSSQKILANIKKRVPLSKAKEIVAMTKAAGIDVRAMFMFGNPGETEETMEDTIKFAISLDADLYLFNITTPFPGTEMFAWAQENGYLKTRNWDDYDLSHQVMELPTASSKTIREYYRKAYRRCYLRPAYMLKRLKKINSTSSLKAHMRMIPYLLGT